MNTDPLQNADLEGLPGTFPLTVIMEKRPSTVSTWVDAIWTAIGVTAGSNPALADASQVAYPQDDVELRFYQGFQVRLYLDECDSYYHNLMSPSPNCFIVVRQDEEDDRPEPFLVSLSFDEAHAYLEGDDTVFAVDMPPELYRWAESFVLAHYCPQQTKKRKRKNWKQNDTERRFR